MKTTNTKNKLLMDAAEWRLISLLFDCPNDRWFEDVASLAGQVSDTRLTKAARAAQKEASEGLFHSTFGPGGPAPGREVSYRGWVQPGFLLSELSSFYNAFSYEPNTREVPDHIAVETGFVAYLKLKELYALENDDAEKALITADASRTFVDEHVSKYAEKIMKLLAASGIPYLKLASVALFKRVGRDKDKGKQIYLPTLEDADEPMFECGAAAV
jgi:nitrate reductase assembly molybdenum cofactor insertion protein NarJ